MKKKYKKIIVIKIGTSVLLTQENRLDIVRIENIVEQIIKLRKSDFDLILVVSGAVALGSNYINLSKDSAYLRQLAAGIGQVHVISAFKDILVKNKLELAQILLTKDNLISSTQKKKIKGMLLFYARNEFIPIINENDILELNSFGGNDLLAADISSIVKADKLIILSTMKGSVYGVGGGKAKEEAIKILAKEHIEAQIVNGKTKNILLNTVL